MTQVRWIPVSLCTRLHAAVVVEPLPATLFVCRIYSGTRCSELSVTTAVISIGLHLAVQGGGTRATVGLR